MPLPEVVRLTQELVRIDTSVRPDTGLKFLRGLLDRAGVENRVVLSKSGTPVLSAERPGREGSPWIVLGTHLDTVPDPGGGRAQPGEIRSGKLYGRGALDMKAGLASSLLLLRDLPRDSAVRLSLRVTTDEEGDSAGAWSEVRSRGFAPDLVLVPEPSWERVALSASGRRSWEVEFRSPGGHAEGTLGSRNNPAQALGKFVARLPPGLIVTSLSTEGGGEVTLPRVAHARVDQVFVRSSAPSEARGVLRQLAAHAAGGPLGVRPRVALTPRTTPWPDPYPATRTRLVRRLLGAVKETLGRVETFHEAAVGDFNAYATRAPTVIFGPSGDGVHGLGEYVRVPSVLRCHRALERFLRSP